MLIAYGFGMHKEVAGWIMAIIVYPTILLLGLIAWLLPAIIFLWILGAIFR
jgi:hypothetical protein